MSTMTVTVRMTMIMVMMVVMASSRWSGSLCLDARIFLKLLSAANMERPRIHAGSLLACMGQQLDD